jgi:hypothetical protein
MQAQVPFEVYSEQQVALVPAWPTPMQQLPPLSVPEQQFAALPLSELPLGAQAHAPPVA